MTTSKARGANENGQAISSADLPKDHPLAAAPVDSGRSARDWESEAKRAQAEASFWMLKYFEAKQHNDQVIAALARPRIEQSQRETQAQQVELLSRLSELQKSQEGHE